MNILVAYATKAGSTAEVAAEIGRVIESKGGCQVDVRPVGKLKEVGGYDAVIIGSAIRAGKWLPEATKFVEKHRDALSQVPVALFAVCLTLSEDTEENRRTVAAYLDPVREVVQPVDVGLFAGVMDYSKLSFILRLMMKAMKSPEGDFRDWEVIRAWADSVCPLLLQRA
ncbi:MAG: flavodoxin domain-containing protein [Chloroflexi bacterium]|jgi:menaquinone-dependent protoporphyrinogen oxidase|nr:flavodoxin domain-containing protein [Chloroflexota bacterium]